MATIQTFVRKHSVPIYFGLAFALSWGGILLVVGSSGIPGAQPQIDALFPAVYLAMLVGPSVAGVLMTLLVDGTAGLRELFARLRTWRVGVRWYLVALLTAPLLIAMALAVLSLSSPAFRPGIFTAPGKMSALSFGLVIGLGAGFFEEIGWTGFATPRLAFRQAIVRYGFIVGLLWGAWHFLASYWGSAGSNGSVSLALFLAVGMFSFLPPYRVLMFWVYSRTNSLAIAMLMHASLTSSMLILGPLALSGMSGMIYNAVFALILWAAVAAMFLLTRGQPSRQPVVRKAA